MTAVAATGAPCCHRLRHSFTEIETTDALGCMVARFAYTVGPTGRRIRETQHGGRTTDYGHDALYRLVSETVTHSGVTTRNASYQYDAVGNRTRSEVDGVTTLYSYDANDRLLSAGGTSYRYDAQGNLLSEEDGADETRYAYDQRDRLIQAEEFSGGAAAGSVALAYDFDGNRIARTQAGITTGFVVDANRGFTQVLQETDGSGALQATYTLGGERISQHRGGAVRHYHADALGSTRLLTDAAGTETDAYAYEAFGELLSRSGTTDNPFRFTGEALDPALGLYDLRARYYAPALGRFTQRDTFPGFEQRPLSLNEYLYADADPVNNIDPSGRFSLAGFGAGFNIQGALMTTAVGAAGASLLAAVISIDDPDRIIARKRARTRWDVIIGGFQVRRCVVSRDKRCRANIPVLLLGADNLQQTRHVFDAQEAGIGVTPLKRQFPPHKTGRFFPRQPECKGKVGGMSGRDCDEYPYKSTLQGGVLNYRAGRVSLRAIDSGHNQNAGSKLGAFYSDCEVSKTNDVESWFGVVALPSLPRTKPVCSRR